MPLLPAPVSDLLQATMPWMLLGAAVGLAHLASLRWTLALFTARGALAWALLLQGARLALVAGALAFAAFAGATALLTTAGALMLVRMILLRALAPRRAVA